VQSFQAGGGSKSQRSAVALDELKRSIDLTRFAGVSGWLLDVSGGMGGRHFQMRQPDGQREIVVSRSLDGQWRYFRRDSGEGGSIIDFAQKELGWGDLGSVRKRLSEVVAGSLPPPERKRFASFPIAKPRGSEAAPQAATIDAIQYLQNVRGFRAETLDHFSGSWLDDGRGNAVFPHTEAGGHGGEIRGAGFQGFSAGGTKSLWAHIPDRCEKLVICESAIDAMSHAQAHGLPDNTGYVSVGGGFGIPILDAIIEIARRMTAVLLAAFDRDSTGEFNSARTIMHGRAAGLEVVRDAPPEGRKDWNEVICAAPPQVEATEEIPSLSAGEWEKQIMFAVNMEDAVEIRRLLKYGRSHLDLADGFIDETIRYAERHLLAEDLHQ
jgi:hypothetical protein